MNKSLEDIVGELDDGEKYFDDTFTDRSKLCKTYQENSDVEFIRASKIPILTDEDGDVHMFKDKYTDQAEEVHLTDMKTEYQSKLMGNSTLSAALEVYSKYVRGHFQ